MRNREGRDTERKEKLDGLGRLDGVRVRDGEGEERNAELSNDVDVGLEEEKERYDVFAAGLNGVEDKRPPGMARLQESAELVTALKEIPRTRSNEDEETSAYGSRVRKVFSSESEVLCEPAR